MTVGAEKIGMTLPKAAAPLIAGITGTVPLSDIRGRAGLDPIAFAALWGQVERELCGYGQMQYSTLLVKSA